MCSCNPEGPWLAVALDLDAECGLSSVDFVFFFDIEMVFYIKLCNATVTNSTETDLLEAVVQIQQNKEL